MAREVAAQPDQLHLVLDSTNSHRRASIVCAQACSRPIKETIQDASAEFQRLGRYSFVDAVEHPHEVQLRRQAERSKTETLDASVVPNLAIEYRR